MSCFFGLYGCALDGTQQVAFLAVLSKVAKRYAVSDNVPEAATEARQRFASALGLTRRESRELLSKVVLGMNLPLPFHWVALSLCHVAVLLYARDLKMPTVQWRAAGALHTFLALLVMELAEGRSTCTLYCHSLLHTWGLPRLSICTSDEAGESHLRLSKRLARVTSIIRDNNIHEGPTHELYMKLLHTSAIRRQGRLWRPQHRPIILEPCIFGAAEVWRNGMVHVLTLWSVVGDAIE